MKTKAAKVCKHSKVIPSYDEKTMEADAVHMDTPEFRSNYPRFEGVCPGCGIKLIAYSSMGHYHMGDW